MTTLFRIIDCSACGCKPALCCEILYSKVCLILILSPFQIRLHYPSAVGRFSSCGPYTHSLISLEASNRCCTVQYGCSSLEIQHHASVRCLWCVQQIWQSFLVLPPILMLAHFGELNLPLWSIFTSFEESCPSFWVFCYRLCCSFISASF